MGNKAIHVVHDTCLLDFLLGVLYDTYMNKIYNEQRTELLISDLGLSTRIKNSLRRAGIKTLEEVMQYPPDSLLRLRGMGKESLAEIIAKVQELGFNEWKKKDG